MVALLFCFMALVVCLASVLAAPLIHFSVVVTLPVIVASAFILEAYYVSRSFAEQSLAQNVWMVFLADIVSTTSGVVLAGTGLRILHALTFVAQFHLILIWAALWLFSAVVEAMVWKRFVSHKDTFRISLIANGIAFLWIPAAFYASAKIVFWMQA